jgi:hypothetical protein
MVFGTGSMIGNLVGTGIIGIFGLIIWFHSRAYLAKYGTVTAELVRLDNPGFGGDVGGHGSCGDGAGHGDCSDGGH